MAKELRLQDPGEGIHEAEIQAILVEPGETVERQARWPLAATKMAGVEAAAA